jgi:putative NIF3 family GTP cyclohydrolase 1 type 2
VQSTIETVIDAIRTEVNDASIAHAVGENARFENAPLDRVVWVHKGGDIQPATWNGPKRVPVNGRVVQFYPAYDDVLTVEAHITAKSEERFEVIRRKLLNATKDLFGTCSSPGRYDKVTEAAKAGTIHGGQVKAVQQFSWRMSIGRERTHQLGRETSSELSPSLPVTELAFISAVSFTYTILPSAPP